MSEHLRDGIYYSITHIIVIPFAYIYSSPKRPSLNKSAKDEVDSPKTTKREKDPDTSASSDDVKPNPVALQTKKSPNQSAKKKTKTTPSPKVTKTNGGKDKKPSAKPSKSPPAKSIKKESPKSVKKEEDETTTTTASPTAAKSIPADEPPAKGIASFFTLKKEMKVQAAGSGHKGVDYNPAKAKYHPVDDAFWNEGEKWVLIFTTYIYTHILSLCVNEYGQRAFMFFAPQSSVLGVDQNVCANRRD